MSRGRGAVKDMEAPVTGWEKISSAAWRAGREMREGS